MTRERNILSQDKISLVSNRIFKKNIPWNISVQGSNWSSLQLPISADFAKFRRIVTYPPSDVKTLFKELGLALCIETNTKIKYHTRTFLAIWLEPPLEYQVTRQKLETFPLSIIYIKSS